MQRLERLSTVRRLTRTLLLCLLLAVLTCSASALWPGDETYGTPPSPATADAGDIDSLYASPDTFTPLELSLDDPSATPSAASSHAFTPLSLSLDQPTSADASYHHFLALGTTAGTDESFHMSGSYHSQPANSPATFDDVSMSIRETDDDSGAGAQYGGVLSMTVKCGNGSIALLDSDGVVIEDGDAVVANGAFTFTNVTFTASLAAANDALSAFTFMPAASSLVGNVSCSYLVLTNQSLYTGQFVFDLTRTPPPAPAATVTRVSFNLTVVPNTTERYALYTGLPLDISAVLNVSQSRLQVIEAVVDAVNRDTVVVMDFLPVGWRLMQANQNDSVAALVAAFVALTPAQLSQTRWMRYVQPDSIVQLCADGAYRLACTVAAPAAAVAAAAAVTSSLAFIVGMSVGGAVLALAAVAGGWRYAVKRRGPPAPPLSPLLKASASEEAHAAVPAMASVLDQAAHDDAVADVTSMDVDEQALFVHDEGDGESAYRSRRSSRVPSARRATKRRSLVQFALPQAGEAERLEMDLRGRLRASGLTEGKRYMYQPQVVVNDTRTEAVRERRHTLVQQLEQRERESAEAERGSLIHQAYTTPATLSTRTSLSPSPLPAPTASVSQLTASVAGGTKHLHYGDDDDSDDDTDGQHTELPKFIDASSATASASPRPQPLIAFTSPSAFQPDHLTAIVPTFPHPSTFLPSHTAAQRSSRSALRRRSISGGLLSQLGGEDGAFDGLHVGYGGGDDGSGANTPSLSTQDVAHDWLAGDDADALDRLEQGSPYTLRRALSGSPFQSQRSLDAPAAHASLQLPETKRGSWRQENAKRRSYSAKRQSGRANIVLDLSQAGLSLAPQLPLYGSSNDKAGAAAPHSGSLWNKLVGGTSKVNGAAVGATKRPSTSPLMTSTSMHLMHHPRLSLYQHAQRAVF